MEAGEKGREVLRGGKWGTRGEAGGEGEGSGCKGGGKRGLGTPLSTPTFHYQKTLFIYFN